MAVARSERMGTLPTYAETVRWLEEHGGSWAVRATASQIAVVAWLGGCEVVQFTTELTCARVEMALVDAVDELRKTV